MDPTMEAELPGMIARLVIYVVMVVLVIIPSLRILGRIGLSKWWSALTFIPLGFVVVLWMVAYRRWPKEI